MLLRVDVQTRTLSTKELGVVELGKKYEIDEQHSFIVEWRRKSELVVRILRTGMKNAIRKETVPLLSDQIDSFATGTVRGPYLIDLSPRRKPKSFPFGPALRMLRRLAIPPEKISPMFQSQLSEYFPAGLRHTIHTDGELHGYRESSNHPVAHVVTGACWAIVSSSYSVGHIYLWPGAESEECMTAIANKIQNIRRQAR